MDRLIFGLDGRLDGRLDGGLDDAVSIVRFRSRTGIGTVRSPGTARKSQIRLPSIVPASI